MPVSDQLHPICQHSLPIRPWAEPDLSRLPGMRPVGMDEWLIADEVHDAQMALRDRLLAARRPDVFAPAPIETVTRLDGVRINLEEDHPLAVVARLVQEDVCLLAERAGAYVLDGAALLFPASWSLREKLGRAMIRIHGPVASFDDALAKRVHRLFQGLRAGQPLMRGNALLYDDADLFHPANENARRVETVPEFLRVERQCLLRLPKSQAVAFTIHTYVMDLNALPAADRAALEAR